MSIVLDLIIIGIIVFFAFSSARQGFVRVLIETVGFVVAIMAATALSTPIAELTYDKVIEPPIVNAAVEYVDSGTADDAANALPSFLGGGNLDIFGLNIDTSFTAKINENIVGGAENAVKTASAEVIRPIAVKILGLLYSLILTVVLMLAVKLVARLVNKLFSFSVVGKLNRTLGGIVGALKGCAAALVFCMAVTLIIAFTGKELWIFTRENIEASHIFKLFTEIFPIK